MKRKYIIGLLLFTAITSTMGLSSEVQASEATNAALSQVSSYLEPRLLTGKIYDLSDPKRILFQFKRTATNSGSRVYVLREYTLPDGKLASVERVVYEGNQLLSYQLDDLQVGAQGRADVKATGKSPKDKQINFQVVKSTTKKKSNEPFLKDILINDMVGPFISDHWNALTNGQSVKLRMVAMSRTETVGFKLTQISQNLAHGKPVAILRMEPTSLIIARFVDPLYFTVEKEAPHRVLQYSGRTTPSILRKGKWQDDLDALTIFDW